MNKTKIIQQYVVNDLIKKQVITIEDLIHDIFEVCSEEQVTDILIKYLNTIKNNEDSKDNNEDNENEKVFISVKCNVNETSSKLLIVKAVKDNLQLGLKEAKDFVDYSREHRAVFGLPISKQVAKKLKSEIEPLGGIVDIN